MTKLQTNTAEFVVRPFGNHIPQDTFLIIIFSSGDNDVAPPGQDTAG